MEPMLLKTVGKDYLWGETRPKTEFDKDLDVTPLAESWECFGQCVVSNGCYKGRTHANALNKYSHYYETKTDGGLPTRAKFIDIKLDLSVQVHLDDEYARVHENQSGKDEMG